jgi:hypothetical protein
VSCSWGIDQSHQIESLVPEYFYVTRARTKEAPNSVAKMADTYLKHLALENDTVTERRRVFYGVHHTYTTLALTYGGAQFNLLAKQSGASVQMIDRQYSHLQRI